MNYSISHEKGISDYYCCLRYSHINSALHVHSHIEFVFVLDGELDFTVGEGRYSITKGQAAVIMPYEVHGYNTVGKSDVFILACPPEYISEYRQILQGKVFEPPYTNYSKDLTHIISKISESENKDQMRMKGLIYCVLSDLMLSCRILDADVFEYDVYRSAISYISEKYCENITLQKTALHIGVTPSHLSRVLNSDDKPGFSEIVNSLRVYAAKQMLEQRNISVSEVAFETGFGSIRNFNRIFKKFFGCKPCDVRKNV